MKSPKPSDMLPYMLGVVVAVLSALWAADNGDSWGTFWCCTAWLICTQKLSSLYQKIYGIDPGDDSPGKW